ncbi:MAG: ATP-binding cassette domain-containing protein [Desulfobacula sp.]|nr:ATP-binding cassette domain-containing protein [Desulfobacula sp.]
MEEVKMLKAINITKRFGALAAVNDLSFEVEAGQVFGIAGPNGAGKSTLYNLITGFYKYEGKIEFDGKNISGLPTHKIARLGISRTFQIPQIFESLTVEESVNLGCRFGNSGKYDPGYSEEMISFASLKNECSNNTSLLNLLGKKRLMIAAALATKPKILMVDEPMAGLNASEINQMTNLKKNQSGPEYNSYHYRAFYEGFNRACQSHPGYPERNRDLHGDA